MRAAQCGARYLVGGASPLGVGRSAARRGALAVLLLSLLGIATLSQTIPSAHAHDQLVESVPTDGAELGTPPEEIALRYSSELIPLGTEVRVTDDQGRTWVDGPPDVSGRTVTQPLQRGPGGGQFTVRWRVVSSDGHPISGRQTYTVTQTAPTGAASTPAPGTAVSPTTTAAASPTTTAAASPTTIAAASPTASAAAAPPLLPWLGGLIGLGAVLAAAWWLSRRRFA